MTRDIQSDRLRREAESAAALLDGLRDTLGDDAERNDAIEGETNLLEAIDMALAEIDDNQAMVTGLDDLISKYQDRRARCKRRVETLRELILQAMATADMKTLKLAQATLTARDVAPKPIITDEALVPADYWKQPPPVLDKAKIGKDANDTAIPGVTLSNGGLSLTIRRQ